MTSYQGKRCSHCRAAYHYQASGPGCGNVLNDSRYCPICKGTINHALSALPVLFECRYFPVSEVPAYADVTRAHIEQWEAALAELRKAAVVAQRIWPALIDLKTGDTQSIRAIVASSGPHIGTPFRVSSWESKPEYLIEVGLEWDIMSQTAGGVWR
jgi:hypothetical protein